MDTSSANSPAVGRAQPAAFQFSLRTLLFGITLLSIPLTLVHWLGLNYLFSVAFSTCLIVICIAVYKPRSPKSLLVLAGLAFPASIGITIFYVMATSSFGGTGPFVFHTIINFFVCIVCVLVHCSHKSLTVVLCIAAIAPYAMKISAIQQVRHTYEQMLVDYPLESLETRLVFENHTTRPQNSQETQTTGPSLSRAVLNNLTEQEQRYASRREWALTQLHENYSNQFAAATGFGLVRMRRLTPYSLEPEPLDFVQFPLPIKVALFDESNTGDSLELHQLVTFDIFNRDKIGYVRDLQHVAGFQSHSPTYLSESIERNRCCDEEDTPPRWQLTRLELVSLLRHSSPRVYVSDTLPEMDELDNFEHRALSLFENGTLPQLRTEKDVVAEFNEDRILMVGALRAGNDCLQCHEGKRGKLLGALSYELARLDMPSVATTVELTVRRDRGTQTGQYSILAKPR